MDEEQERSHLRKAEDDIAEARRRVEEQQGRIARMAADGHDTATAEALLATMMQTVGAMEEHRRIILRERGREV